MLSRTLFVVVAALLLLNGCLASSADGKALNVISTIVFLSSCFPNLALFRGGLSLHSDALLAALSEARRLGHVSAFNMEIILRNLRGKDTLQQVYSELCNWLAQETSDAIILDLLKVKMVGDDAIVLNETYMAILSASNASAVPLFIEEDEEQVLQASMLIIEADGLKVCKCGDPETRPLVQKALKNNQIRTVVYKKLKADNSLHDVMSDILRWSDIRESDLAHLLKSLHGIVEKSGSCPYNLPTVLSSMLGSSFSVVDANSEMKNLARNVIVFEGDLTAIRKKSMAQLIEAVHIYYNPSDCTYALHRLIDGKSGRTPWAIFCFNMSVQPVSYIPCTVVVDFGVWCQGTVKIEVPRHGTLGEWKKTVMLYSKNLSGFLPEHLKKAFDGLAQVSVEGTCEDDEFVDRRAKVNLQLKEHEHLQPVVRPSEHDPKNPVSIMVQALSYFYFPELPWIRSTAATPSVVSVMSGESTYASNSEYFENILHYDWTAAMRLVHLMSEIPDFGVDNVFLFTSGQFVPVFRETDCTVLEAIDGSLIIKLSNPPKVIAVLIYKKPFNLEYELSSIEGRFKRTRAAPTGSQEATCKYNLQVVASNNSLAIRKNERKFTAMHKGSGEIEYEIMFFRISEFAEDYFDF